MDLLQDAHHEKQDVRHNPVLWRLKAYLRCSLHAVVDPERMLVLHPAADVAEHIAERPDDREGQRHLMRQGRKKHITSPASNTRTDGLVGARAYVVGIGLLYKTRGRKAT